MDPIDIGVRAALPVAARSKICACARRDPSTRKQMVQHLIGKSTIMPSWLPVSFDRRMLVSGILGTVCLAAGPVADASTTFDGVYSGERSLTKGSAQCVSHDDVSLIIKGKTATFSDSGFQNYVMSFSPHEDGSFRQISTYPES